MKDNIGLIERFDKYNNYTYQYKRSGKAKPVTVPEWITYHDYFSKSDFSTDYANKYQIAITTPSEIDAEVNLRGDASLDSRIPYEYNKEDIIVRTIDEHVLTYRHRPIITNKVELKYFIDVLFNSEFGVKEFNQKVEIPLDA
ncbi:MAG: hypothetical protein OWS74_01730 [Firmicutes bacterium]|nr:hypothetical protein [Bacillota bacterium]